MVPARPRRFSPSSPLQLRLGPRARRPPTTRHPRRHDLRRQRRRAAYAGRRRHQGRPHRRDRPAHPRHGARAEVDARGLAVAPGLHQHAELGGRAADPRRPGAERRPPGRHPRSDGRGLVDGARSARPRKPRPRPSRPTTRYPIGWTTLGEFLAFLERKGVSVNVASMVGASTVRVHELGRNDVDPDPRAAGADARAGPPGDGRGRDGGRLVAHLRPRRLCRDRRAGRAGERGGALRRHVYQPYAQREQRPARGDRRAGRDQPAAPAPAPRSTISRRRAAPTGR